MDDPFSGTSSLLPDGTAPVVTATHVALEVPSADLGELAANNGVGIVDLARLVNAFALQSVEFELDSGLQ